MSRITNPFEWVEVPCALCGSEESETLYERTHETGSSLGRIVKTDVLCRRCGFAYTSPRPSPASMDRYYAEASGASGSVFHSTEPGSRLHGLTNERLAFMDLCIDQVLGKGSGRILDVGCSTGDLLKGFERPGWQKLGIEPSQTAVQRARERGLDVVSGGIESASGEARDFDVASCISALEHVQDPLSVMSRLAEAVVPGGLVFVEVPDSTRPVAQVAEFYSFEHLSHFTRGSLLRCLAAAGLEAVRFDDAVSIPNLRVCARRVEQVAAIQSDPERDRAELIEAVRQYSAERAEFETALTHRLGERVSRWRQENSRVALYGAGMHTRFLMGLFDLEETVACVLDSDPAKAGSDFLRWRVHGPDEIERLSLDAIVISTQAFENEVFDQLAPVARDQAIEVVRCYA